MRRKAQTAQQHFFERSSASRHATVDLQKKTTVILAIRDGQITRREACERYRLSREELAAWEAVFDQTEIATRVVGPKAKDFTGGYMLVTQEGIWVREDGIEFLADL